MRLPLHHQDRPLPHLAWVFAAFAGSLAPALALFLVAEAPLAAVAGPIFAVGLMGAGMIAAAADGRFGIGVLVALLNGAGLILVAQAVGMSALPDPVSALAALIIASLSFAARGALFARSAAARGWWIAVAVVAGEAAVVLTAVAAPSTLPGWLLALLPAQWASIAIQAALTDTGTSLASAALLALAGTAAATLLVARLWPRRWPYLVMFTTWLSLSALVWHRMEGVV
jgi:hypothetical protein